MKVLQAAVRETAGPLYRGIADAIAEAIARHDLRPGDRLPPQRQLADALHVDLTTVTRAYGMAHQRGLLEARVGRGTFVRATPQAAAPGAEAARGPVDMSMNLPPLPDQPSLREMLLAAQASLLDSEDLRALMTYRTGAGTLRDRTAAADWLRPMLGALDPARILVCPGAQSALTALMTTLARPGDTVLTAPLSYPGLRALAAQLGLRLAAVAADEHGLLPEAVDKACGDRRPKAIYCVPTIDNPTTATLPPARREALAQCAARHAVPIIEDDAYGLFPARPLPAVVSLAAGAGYYIGTLAKCLSPGLRTAFVVAPGRPEATRLVEAVRATSLAASALLTGMVTRWIEDGAAARLRDAIRQEAAARQAIAREVLAGSVFAAHPEGLHLWLSLPACWPGADFTAHLRQRGLALVASDSFAVTPGATNGVRVCLGAAEDRESLRRALTAVADALRLDAPTHLAAIV